MRRESRVIVAAVFREQHDIVLIALCRFHAELDRMLTASRHLGILIDIGNEVLPVAECYLIVEIGHDDKASAIHAELHDHHDFLPSCGVFGLVSTQWTDSL